MKIAVIGLGYVGLANAVLLAQNNEVKAFDILPDKVRMLNNKISPIQDKEIEEYLKNKELNLKGIFNLAEAIEDTEYVLIATPTNYDSVTNNFDTTSIESIVSVVLQSNSRATIIIKSTIPLGYTQKIRQDFNTEKIVFSPEFLREGKALYDNLYPSRIIVGDNSDEAKKFADLMKQGALKKAVPVLCTHPTEAEAIKLFANTFLAMRVAFFNELDTYAETKGLSSKEIIQGVSLDPRIGNYYNNPSFGYGGYCLPKDTKQLLANYGEIPNEMITAVVKANQTRKDYIVSQILEKNPSVVGVYRLAMKSGSDNFRESSVIDIIKELRIKKIFVLIFEPLYGKEEFHGAVVTKDFDYFTSRADVVIANRYDSELEKIRTKVYSRDIFGKD